MKRILVAVTVLALLVAWVAVVQAQTKDQQIAADVARKFIQELLPQIKANVDMQKILPDIKGPQLLPDLSDKSYYCMYYRDDPAYRSGGKAYHTFGWYSESVGCGALYPLVYGVRYRPCRLNPDFSHSSPWSNVPIGWKIQIPDTFMPVGLWLNNEYGPTGSHIDVGGLYFTNPHRNRDGQPHAYIWAFYLPSAITLYCQCDGGSTTMTVHTIYVITWEDWCHGGDHDWNDFLVALFH